MSLGYYMFLNRRKRRCLRFALLIFVIVAILLYLIFPIIFKSSPSLQRFLIFRNDDNYHRGINFSYPETENLFGARNHYIITEIGITLGVWQILPADLLDSLPSQSQKEKEWFHHQLSDSRPVILYCHGNHRNRGASYRILMYKVFQKMNFHVVTFDYRGFGDSSPTDPSENGLVEDTLEVVHWIRRKSDSPLYLWGHSLGSGVATRAAAKLCRSSTCPDALILQAPFTSLEEVVYSAQLSSLFQILPWFNFMFITPLKNQNLLFDNTKHIKDVRCSILILHAHDDDIVPIELGQKLYEQADLSKKSNQVVKFVDFPKVHNYGHNYICRAPELPEVIRSFLEEASRSQSNKPL